MADYTVQEVARQLGLSESSVRSYASRWHLGTKTQLLLSDKDIAILEKRRTSIGRPQGIKRKDYDPSKRQERYLAQKTAKK